LYKPDACEYSLGEEKRQLIHVSNFRPIKRVSDLVTAFAQIADKVPDVELLLIGDGPTRPEVDRLVRKFELNDRVKCPGFKRDVFQYLRCAHAFCLSSELEGAPLSLLEAMSCGLPVVTTAVGGIPEIIQDGENGLLVPFGDLDTLADKLYAVLTDSTLAGDLGLAARQTILEKHTADKVLPQYEAIYESILS
jgi:glycosyltransferase involved in cell wall biosynthesis